MSVKYIDREQVTEVKVDVPSYRGEAYNPYLEQSTSYMIKYKGRWRRVYATAIGNVSVVYLKGKEGIEYLDTDTEHDLEELWEI